jgi:RNA-directed DNA polymerase
VNTGELASALIEADGRVLGIQTKLHRWAVQQPGRRFDDLFNLVCDPAVLLLAWWRVRGNRGARTAGVDGITAHAVRLANQEQTLLEELRADLKGRRFRPLPVRERMIPKTGGKLRRLGIPTVRDRVVQAALKLVLEPIFEAEFHPCSYGFRPGRRAQDAIAEIHLLGSRSYEWVLEGDIEACFDMIDHTALLGRVRCRVGDKRVLALVKAFLKAGILTEDDAMRDTSTGTPQGGILSPLLANVALSVLDEHFAGGQTGQVERRKRRRHGLANYRLIRYADDFVVMVAGTRAHAEALVDQAAAVLAPMGLRLSATKTQVVHLDEGFDFLGWHIQRRRRRGTDRVCVYTYPSKKALAAIIDTVRALTRRSRFRQLSTLLDRLNPALRGWCAYFRHGVSAATFQYLDAYTWRRVVVWLRKRHPGVSWASLRRRYLPGWRPTTHDGSTLFNSGTVTVSRYRYRGTRIPTPWTTTRQPLAGPRRELVESRMR